MCWRVSDLYWVVVHVVVHELSHRRRGILQVQVGVHDVVALARQVRQGAGVPGDAPAGQEEDRVPLRLREVLEVDHVRHGREDGRVGEGVVRARAEDEVGVDLIAERVECRVVDVEQHSLVRSRRRMVAVVRLPQVLLGGVDDPAQLVGIGAGRRERMQRNGRVDRVDPGRVDGVAVVGLDRGLDLVDVLDLVGAGRVGRRRRDRVVAVCTGGQRQPESGDRGDPRRERETNGAPFPERRERAIHL